MNAQERETYIVWVGNADRIASFSKVEGYEKKTFSNHEFFMSFLWFAGKRISFSIGVCLERKINYKI